MKLCEKCKHSGRCENEKNVREFIKCINVMNVPRYVHGWFTCSRSVVAVMQKDHSVDFLPIVTLTGEDDDENSV